MTMLVRLFSGGWIVLAGLVSGCAGAPASQAGLAADAAADGGPRVVDLRDLPSLEAIIPRLDGTRVVLVGETHDRYDHHLAQLAVIQALHRRRGEVAIGMEFFQQPFQPVLDDYVAGRISEREMLERSEYYDRWRFDHRLYRPVYEYAREHRIPLIALNLPQELTRRAGQVGIEGLGAEERASVPAEIDRSDEAYHQRLRAIYDQHPQNGGFERFLDVQLLWDEGMAERAARYLQENPARTLVVLAGSGHLAHRSGIPNRLTRRTGEAAAVLLPADAAPLAPGVADYLVTSAPASLPPAGKLGVMLDTTGERLKVTAFDPTSTAKAAGLRVGDRLLAIDGTPVRRFADVKVALADKRPGDTVRVEAERGRLLAGEKAVSADVQLR